MGEQEMAGRIPVTEDQIATWAIWIEDLGDDNPSRQLASGSTSKSARSVQKLTAWAGFCSDT